ncbi:hypothetical protein MU516_16635 [Paracoccus sp. YLB-12]|uniref:Uncharacterized protein n=1 Tax=Paracoccus maritimus TaxID=2933292 RepID=A0ABT2KD58_9RHOB|nr:hypothetical protein [Paracoccus sp. YLB-12]MCT4334485.1 hypothetical protein [Paracoccus sp. YLB-12]
MSRLPIPPTPGRCHAGARRAGTNAEYRSLGVVLGLDPAKLDATGQAAFAALPTAPALPALSDLGTVLAEPHPDWMTRLTAAWQDRYTR